ncbi:Ring finger domain-containing protein 6 [Elsinoe fawcettii]|nr:Ring finger domain-containing protein 6 [Elsinoe fawcettii]
MDRSSQQRDIVFCHQCENEWYRDEHGLSCPRCHSDFCEVVEAGHDPREDHPPELPPRPDDAPDPDEDDIARYGWRPTPSGGATFTYTSPGSPRGQQQGQQGGPGFPPIIGSFASMLGSMLGGRPLPTGAQPQQGQAVPGDNFHGSGRTIPEEPGYRPQSAPGSPGLTGVHAVGNTTIRMGGGPGFQWRITTSSGPAQFPRDPHSPQPFHDPHQDLQPFLQMMFGGPPGQMGGRPGDPFHRGDPFGQGADPMTMGPFGPLFAGLLNPAMMRSGDGVYSQEALDRIISQLMEQNASGNAPGPAPAEAISSLPKREINEKDLGSEGKAECSICMDEVKLGDQVTELPCHHWFHGECVKAWLSEHDTCPHCRQGIMPKEGAEGESRARNPHEAPRHDQMWGQGDGSQTNPFVVPESPNRPGNRRRHSSNAGPSRNNSNEGLFSRMRNAFGGGGS